MTNLVNFGLMVAREGKLSISGLLFETWLKKRFSDA